MANEDRPYLAWIHRQPCCASPTGQGCHGQVEAHHAGPKGLSQRAHDHTAIPLCLQHHRDWHMAYGMFRDMGREDRREWSSLRIAETRARHERPAGELVCEAMQW